MKRLEIEGHHIVYIFAIICAALIAIFGPGCTTVVEQPISLRPCDPTSSTTEPAESSSSAEESSSTTRPPLACPTIADGYVAFELESATRTVYFDGIDEATGLGPAVLAWRGTYETVAALLAVDMGVALRQMAIAEGGVIAVAESDPDAYDDGEPFPWFIICGPGGTQCDREDDFELAALVAGCLVEQGLAAPNRLTAAGLSAGGIFSSHLVERGLGELELAAVVSWSGGLPLAFQPATPASDGTSVFMLHGGPLDLYCGNGQPTTGCYGFAEPTEQTADQIEAAGNFVFVCNHDTGYTSAAQAHSARMEGQAAEFLAAARSDAPHPWIGFPFGVPGSGGWPAMSGGANWMLRNWGDCYLP